MKHSNMIILKRYVTLLEVLIAMTLTSLILMALTFFYQQVAVIGIEMDRTKIEGFDARYVEKRLSDIIPRIIGSSNRAQNYGFFSVGDEGIAMPGSQSLIFTFDNGACSNRWFAGNVVGRLLLDPQGQLLLLLWPLPRSWDKSTQEWPVKKEVLLTGVESMTFEYFIAPAVSKPLEIKPDQSPPKNPNGNPSSPNGVQAPPKNTQEPPKPEIPTPEPKGEWRQQPWVKEFVQLPVMLKIVLTMPRDKDTEKLIFIFPLAESNAHIIYD